MWIQELRLHTHPLEELASFYASQLKMPVETSDRDRIRITIGETILVFQRSVEHAYYHFAINIPAGQIEAAHHWLQSRVALLPFQGKEILEFPHWQARALYFLDPAGNIVELIARDAISGPEMQEDQAPVYLSVSEIGLPTEEVGQKVLHLQQSYGLPQYDGDLHRFSAVGDPNGLFIVVKAEEKNWLPTEIPARPFPVSIRFIHERQSYVLLN